MAAKKRNTGEAVPQGVVSRLPVYYRYLSELEGREVERISSAQFGEAVDCTAAQIRSDLSYFGSFGQQGYGYNVSDLLQQLEKILGGLHRTYSVVWWARATWARLWPATNPFGPWVFKSRPF